MRSFPTQLPVHRGTPLARKARSCGAAALCRPRLDKHRPVRLGTTRGAPWPAAAGRAAAAGARRRRPGGHAARGRRGPPGRRGVAAAVQRRAPGQGSSPACAALRVGRCSRGQPPLGRARQFLRALRGPIGPGEGPLCCTVRGGHCHGHGRRGSSDLAELGRGPAAALGPGRRGRLCRELGVKVGGIASCIPPFGAFRDFMRLRAWGPVVAIAWSDLRAYSPGAAAAWPPAARSFNPCVASVAADGALRHRGPQRPAGLGARACAADGALHLACLGSLPVQQK
mmetsp:Transcript_69487/g.203308  ORF Transcript_69487/g.203308 Transcript_69487/m.203308 type:complete len:283 (-) Transcript_69487:1215-2063(-)